MLGGRRAPLKHWQYIFQADQCERKPRCVSRVFGLMGGETFYQRSLTSVAVNDGLKFIIVFPDQTLLRQRRLARARCSRTSAVGCAAIFGISKTQRYGTIRYKLTGTLHFTLVNYSAAKELNC